MNSKTGFITFNKFNSSINISMEEICLDFIQKNRDTIKVQKEKTILKNMITIVKSTIKLSNEKGFQNMSMRDLSQETNLSMGALYSYFPGKIELLTMIHEQGTETVINLLKNQIESTFTPTEKLEQLICLHLYISEVMKEWFYFFYMETKNLDKKNQKKPIQSELMTEELFINILEEGRKEKFFNIENTLLLASSIKAMLQDWYLKRWKYKMRKISVEEYARFMISFIKSSIMTKKKK